MNIVFMGHGKWACETLRTLVAGGMQVAAVACERDEFDQKEDEHYRRLAGFGFYESLKEAARQLQLPVEQPEDVNSDEFIKKLDRIKPDLIVIVSYHPIIRKAILSGYKVINAHGAPLPSYRGRAPINWAIINGEKETGVTVHEVNEDIDTGDIILQERIPISEDDAAIDVLKRSLECYPRLVSRAIGLIESGKAEKVPQDPFAGSYFPKRKPEDGNVDWSWTAQDIYNFMRALTHPYPGAFTSSGGKKVYLWKAENPKNNKKRVSPVAGLVFGKTAGGGINVTTRDSSITVTKVQIEHEKEKNAAEIIKVGTRFG